MSGSCGPCATGPRRSGGSSTPGGGISPRRSLGCGRIVRTAWRTSTGISTTYRMKTRRSSMDRLLPHHLHREGKQGKTARPRRITCSSSRSRTLRPHQSGGALGSRACTGPRLISPSTRATSRRLRVVGSGLPRCLTTTSTRERRCRRLRRHHHIARPVGSQAFRSIPTPPTSPRLRGGRVVQVAHNFGRPKVKL